MPDHSPKRAQGRVGGEKRRQRPLQTSGQKFEKVENHENL